MLDKLAAIEAKYSQIEARLAAPETYDDPAQVAKLNKEQNELAPVVETYRPVSYTHLDVYKRQGEHLQGQVRAAAPHPEGERPAHPQRR